MGPSRASNGNDQGKRRLALYEELDRLEELLEDMLELDVRSIEDIERRMEALNEAIDEFEAGDGDQARHS
jgi:hypothetical protein